MNEKIKTEKGIKALIPVSKKPSWESRNEGVHERVNFDDTIWGFELAGGAYYKTPLRVTRVKPDSRGEKVGIRVGDVLRNINGISTLTLTLQEAHDLILESGIEIKLELYAEDEVETGHYVYQDEIEDDDTAQRGKHDLEIPVKDYKFKGAKTNEAWSLIWPCNKKRDILYKESNCFLVPSSYETKHPERLLRTSGNGGN